MSNDNDTQQAADAIIAEVRQRGCEDRGEGLKPRHVYVDGSGKCCCGKGPDLTKERMK